MAYIEGEGWSAEILEWSSEVDDQIEKHVGRPDPEELEADDTVMITVEVTLRDTVSYVVTFYSVDGFTEDELASIIEDSITNHVNI